MDEDDLRELVLAIDIHGALSGEDSHRLIVEVRRLRKENARLRELLAKVTRTAFPAPGMSR